VAWARRHGVTPPPELVAEAERETAEQSATADGTADGACHVAQTEHPGGNCCQSDQEDKDRASTVSVVLIQALKCQGVGENWLGIPLAVPLPAPCTVSNVAAPDEWLVVAPAPAAFSPSFPPPVPPPQTQAC
jgi:hypothetical protein